MHYAAEHKKPNITHDRFDQLSTSVDTGNRGRTIGIRLQLAIPPAEVLSSIEHRLSLT